MPTPHLFIDNLSKYAIFSNNMAFIVRLNLLKKGFEMIKDINSALKIAALTFFAFFTSTHCSEQFWYNSINSETIRCFVYGKSTAIIDKVIGLRSTIQKSYMKNNPDVYIKTLKNKLSLIEKNIRAAEQKQIYEVAKENDLDDQDTNRIFSLLNKFHNDRKQNFGKPQPIGNHEIDPNLTVIIKKQLAKYNIDVASVDLINEELENMELAEATCPMPSEWNLSSENFIYEDIIPGSIKFSPRFYRHVKTKKAAKTIIIHEIAHFTEGHHLTCFMTQWAIQALKDIDTIKIGKPWHKLKQIHERQAEILPSLKDKKSASLIRFFRSGPNGTYPGVLYEKHYWQLSDIDETHKMIAYLEDISTKNNS